MWGGGVVTLPALPELEGTSPYSIDRATVQSLSVSVPAGTSKHPAQEIRESVVEHLSKQLFELIRKYIDH